MGIGVGVAGFLMGSLFSSTSLAVAGFSKGPSRIVRGRVHLLDLSSTSLSFPCLHRAACVCQLARFSSVQAPCGQRIIWFGRAATYGHVHHTPEEVQAHAYDWCWCCRILDGESLLFYVTCCCRVL